MGKQVELAVVLKPYGGAEGTRVHAGTRFAVGKPLGDLQVISLARFNSLKDSRLVRAFDPELDGAALPKKGDKPRNPPQEAAAEPQSDKTRRNVRARTRARTPQVEKPEAPARISPPGPQTGGGGSASPSPGAPLSSSSISRPSGRRGNRTAPPSSPSTTPTR